MPWVEEEERPMPAFVIAAAIIAAPTPPAGSPPPDACHAAPMTPTQSTAPLRPRKLGDLPDGHLMRAVLLKVGPCSASIVKEPAGFGRGAWRYELSGLAAVKPSPTGR